MSSTNGSGPLTRFLRFTTRDEPVITAGVVAALVLYLLDRWFGLTEDDLELLGILVTPVAAAVLARFKAWSPSSVAELRDAAYRSGQADQVRAQEAAARRASHREMRRPRDEDDFES